jgi:hypothetical protein
MAKYEKPVTDNMKQKVNRLYLYLKEIGRYATKEEIGEFLGVKSEREVRDIISVLATRKPIISKSNSCGYRLAMTIDDLEEVENVWCEIDSRIEQLEERKKPLIAFREKMKYGIGEKSND